MINSVIQTWQADFFDRVRRRNYLVILLCMSVVTALFFPNNNDGYATVMIGGYRGIYDSQWMGASLAILSVSFLPIICFYLIKNAIEGDRNRGIGELIAATPITKPPYIFGKWLSNLTLLIGIMLVMTLASALVQLWHGESYAIDFIDLLLPQLLFVVPILAVISAFAVLFETIPVLRGGVGNVIYFFLWMGIIVYAVEGNSGIGHIIEQIRSDILVHDPASDGGVSIGINIAAEKPLKMFDWQGMSYATHAIESNVTMFGLSLLLLIAATICFDRFKSIKAPTEQKGENNRLRQKLSRLVSPMATLFERLCAASAFTRILYQECLLLLRGSSTWWYIILVGLGVAQLLAPIEAVRTGVIPASWLLCVLMFSPMGFREKQQSAEQLFFSCPSPMKQQFPAMVLAGFLVALLVVSPAFARFILQGELFSALMLLTGALFIPSLALACGALTRTSRTFEILFTVIWYMGPLQRTPFDFVGVDPLASQQGGAPLMFLLASVVLLVAALFGRRLQMS